MLATVRWPGAHVRGEHEGRDDDHREAPTADNLTAQPLPEEPDEGVVDKPEDAAGADVALEVRGQRAR